MNTNIGVAEPGSIARDPGTSIDVVAAEDALGIGTGTDILVVDDSESNLVAYEAALASLGRKLVLVHSGTEALKELLDRDFALVLLDFSMPGLSGIETARMIRTRPRSKGTPILFISGASPSSEVMLQAFEVGALDFIAKPILPEILRAKVSVYLRLQERTAQLLRQSAMLRDAHERLGHAAVAEDERDRARATALRLEKLQELTTALGDTRTPEQVAHVVVHAGAAAVQADAATMWLLASDGSLVMAGSHGAPPAYVERWRTISRDADLPAVQVLRTAQAMWVETELPFAAFPLSGEGGPIGIVSFTYARAHTFSADERTFLFAVVRATEQALERARLHVADERARAASELANKRKDEFLAMLGHELRNPLAAISSAVHLITMRGTGLERETGVLQRQLSQLTRILDDLLDVSRITRGIITLRREPVDLRDAVQDAVEMVQPETTRLGHALVIHVTPNLVVDADRSRLVQVIFNLLSNAVKYTPPPGLIELTAEAANDAVIVSVRDNGPGIPPALRTDIFELFVQGERDLDRRDGGLGIGLTLVRTLVALHGGSIELASEGEATGATFRLRWPRAATAPQLGTADDTRGGRSGVRVLVVDDNFDAAEMLATVVGAMGHIVEVAHRGETALEVAQQFAPDVVLLDVGLPDLDGYQVARRLRTLPNCAATTLVAVTGYGAPEDFARSREAGFAEHIVKPPDLVTLRSVFERFVRPTSST